ncbi:folate-binding protein [Ramlibacter sp.]|uniref:CAF17-like 4Fe-4S cluster assembly/insertion protein YgfZ n=1 Tax=Ramlibacter sp. TaxID=1917967 RepID=UPI00184958F4|nr:folate-binding protein [Ramlibacter sp.]MBA2672821.1 folate-binding protein YgfZ [Ramlibacter sp.]
MHQLPDGVAPLPHWGVIRVQGADAPTFLHNQLTQDFSLLGASEARLAAFCTAKGRMLASFIGIKRAPDDVLLVCSRDVLAPALKRLSMFVLRAKAKLSDATDQFVLRGLSGEALRAVVPQDQQPWQRTDAGEAHVVGLYPADGVLRGLWIAPAGTPEPAGQPLPEDVWRWGEVRSGIAMVGAPVAEAFVPQMLNYESVGGVNFKKGCYPGQEIVARSQFRGTLKRRAYLVHADAALQAGQEVFEASDAQQPAGTVADAAPAPGGGWDAIVSMQVAAAGGQLAAGSATGPALAVLPLPYGLLEDI